MTLRSTMTTLAALGLSSALLAPSALAQGRYDDEPQTRSHSQTQGDGESQTRGQMSDDGVDPQVGIIYTSPDEARRNPGEKTWMQRINTVARKPLRHDIVYLDSLDRESWEGYEVWRGIRDKRPVVARKTLGFHDPDPHRTRWERVLLISRGPIQGTGFDE